MEDLSSKFLGAFGYPQLPTQEALAQEQQQRAVAMEEAAKQERLREQMSRAQALRGKEGNYGSVLSALGSLGSFAGGDANVRRTEERQTTNDSALAGSMAAMQEAEVAKGLRAEQRGQSESFRQWQQANDDRDSQERRTQAQIDAQIRAARIRSSGGNKGHAPKGFDVEESLYEKTDAEGRPILSTTVTRRTNKGTGESVYNYFDPTSKEFVSGSETPPPEMRQNKQRNTVEGRDQNEETKQVGRMATLSEKQNNAIVMLGKKSEANQTEASHEARIGLARDLFKSTLSQDEMQLQSELDTEQLGTKFFYDQQRDSYKETAAYARMEFEWGEKEAAAVLDRALKANINEMQITSREKVADASVTAKNERYFAGLDQNEQQDLRKYSEATLADRNKYEANQSQENLKAWHASARQEDAQKHEIEMAKNAARVKAEQAKLDAEQDGILDENQMGNHLGDYQQRVKGIEDVRHRLELFRDHIAKAVDQGVNISVFGLGDVFNHEAFETRQTEQGFMAGEVGVGGRASKGSNNQNVSGTRGPTPAEAMRGEGGDTDLTTFGGGSKVAGNIGGELQAGSTSTQQTTLPVGQDAATEAMHAGDPFAQEGQSLATQLVAAIVRDLSGLTATNQEYDRLRKTVVGTNMSDDKAVIEMINNLGDSLNQRSLQATAGTLGQVRKRYEDVNKKSYLSLNVTGDDLANPYQRLEYGSARTKPVPDSMMSVTGQLPQTLASLQDPEGTANLFEDTGGAPSTTRSIQQIQPAAGSLKLARVAEKINAATRKTADLFGKGQEAFTDFVFAERDNLPDDYQSQFNFLLKEEMLMMDVLADKDPDQLGKIIDAKIMEDDRNWYNPTNLLDWMSGESATEEALSASVRAAEDRALERLAEVMSSDDFQKASENHPVLPGALEKQRKAQQGYQ